MLFYDRPTSVYRDVPIPFERPRRAADPKLLELEAAITEDFFANIIRVTAA
jgi:hypothetical protein